MRVVSIGKYYFTPIFIFLATCYQYFLYHGYFILSQLNLKHFIVAEMRIFQTFIWDPFDFISVILSSPNDNLVYL